MLAVTRRLLSEISEMMHPCSAGAGPVGGLAMAPLSGVDRILMRCLLARLREFDRS